MMGSAMRRRDSVRKVVIVGEPGACRARTAGPVSAFLPTLIAVLAKLVPL